MFVESSQFDGLARLVASPRRAVLRAILGGALAAASWQATNPAANAKRRKKNKKSDCKSGRQCGRRCCPSGTHPAGSFDKTDRGCVCCPAARTWTSSVGVKRCCDPGTRAIKGITTLGPCCPEEQYCDGECCNNGYRCENGECVQESCVVPGWQLLDCPEGASVEKMCCPPGSVCTFSSASSTNAWCCRAENICPNNVCCPVGG
jgi:hypothetical protein